MIDDSAVSPVAERAEPRSRSGIAGIGVSRGDLAGALVSCLFVVVAFSPILFAGRTLGTASISAGANGTSAFARRPPVDQRHDYRLDPAASAIQFEPWAQVNRRAYAARELPLWNPYEGAGAPLAANMQSASFDPLLIAVNLHPTELVWDLSIIAAFVLGAAATYVFARILGLEIVPAVGASAAFSLSGYFFLNSNNHYTRSYIYLPITLLLIELVLRSKRLAPVIGLGAAVALNIYLGMPEASALVLGTAFVYALVRVAQPTSGLRSANAVRLGSAVALGVLLSAPLLVLFQQYETVSFNTHKTADYSIVYPIRWSLNWIAPFFNGSKVNGTSVIAQGNLVSNWCGGAVAVAALVGLSGRHETRRRHGWLFAGLAVALLAKIHLSVLSWSGHLPLVERIFFGPYGEPVVGFAVAMLAGIGVQVIWKQDLHVRRFVGLMAVGLALLVLVAVTGENGDQLLQPSLTGALGIWGRPVLAGLTVAAAALIASRRSGRRSPERALQLRRMAALAACVGIVVELLSLAPTDIYARRADQFATPGWMPIVARVLGSNRNDRVFGLNAKLFPDTAGAFGLQDIRAVDALYVERYRRFIRTFVQPDFRFLFTGWQTVFGETIPSKYATNSMFDALAVRVVLTQHPIDAAPPNAGAQSQFLLRGKDLDTFVYENLHAFPRAWVVHDLHKVGSESAAFAFLRSRGHVDQTGVVTLDRFDPRHQAVLETAGAAASSVPANPAPKAACAASEPVTIPRYSFDHVTLRVHASCAGLLVLPDTYYPGWTASVNGHRRDILPTDGTFRGVAVPAGRSEVRFGYAPSRFRLGLWLALLGVVAAASAGGLAAWRRRASAVGSDRRAVPS